MKEEIGEGSNLRRALNKTIYKISFTGMMFALVLIFQFIEKFMPFSEFGFVKFNFSLAFILATAANIGYLWAGSLLALRFVFGPLLSGEGYSSISIIGQVILFIVGVLVLLMFYLTRSKHMKFTKSHRYIRIVIITLSVSLVMSILNALVFTPWYFGAFNGGSWKAVGLSEAMRQYQSIRGFYFGIPSYWGGQIAVYTVFNIINLTITLIITFPLLKIVKLLQSRG